MDIRKATDKDLGRMMEIYAEARRFMEENGNPRQWGSLNWPPQWLIEEDIKNEHSYVCTEGNRIIGVFFYDKGEKIEPCYNIIHDGKWQGGDNYGVVHRIASDRSQKGIGKFCINRAFEQCGHLRIDTHGDNKIMQKLLTDLGFVHCGTIYVGVDDDPRLAYEKIRS